MAGLTSATSPAELASAIDKFRTLTDVDGSLWWWPYRYGETDGKAVIRGNEAGKCAWASGVFVLRFIHDVLGLDADVPFRTLRVSPMMPWPQFKWQGAGLGSSRFDFVWNEEGEFAVTNRNTKNWLVRVAQGKAAIERNVMPGETWRLRN
jgi:hypothetical protein